MKWETKTIKTKDIKEAGYNPRKTNSKAKESYKRVTERYGYPEPIVLNKDLTIIGGHQRYYVFLEKKKAELEALVCTEQLTENQEKKLNVLLNSATGYTDAGKLMKLGLTSDDLDALGFREFKLPVIKIEEPKYVEQGKQKNTDLVTLFFTDKEYSEIKKKLTKVIKKNDLKDLTAGFRFLLQKYVN